MAYEAAKEEAEDRAEKAEQKVSVTLEEKKKIIFWDLLFHCHQGDQADAKEANSAGWSMWEAGDQQEDDQVSLFLRLVWSGNKSVRIWSQFSFSVDHLFLLRCARVLERIVNQNNFSDIALGLIQAPLFIALPFL